MREHYIEQRDSAYYFAGSRVSLDSVVCEFLRGESPESIVQAFPSLSLEQVYGGLTFYLAHRSEIDARLKQADERFAEIAHASRVANPLLYAKLEAAKRTAPSTG
jgi:uncharacterized protein (DUF433 family)